MDAARIRVEARYAAPIVPMNVRRSIIIVCRSSCRNDTPGSVRRAGAAGVCGVRALSRVDDRPGQRALSGQAQHTFRIDADVLLHAELELGAVIPVLLDPQILLQAASAFVWRRRGQDSVPEQIARDPIPARELNEEVLGI